MNQCTMLMSESIWDPCTETSCGNQKPYLVSSMRVAPPGDQRETASCATAGAPEAPEATIDERHHSASPTSSTAGVAAQKKRAAACAGVSAISGSRRRDQRNIASVASTANAAPRIRVQSSRLAVSGVEKSIGGAELIPRASRPSQSIAHPRASWETTPVPEGATNRRAPSLFRRATATPDRDHTLATPVSSRRQPAHPPDPQQPRRRLRNEV